MRLCQSPHASVVHANEGTWEKAQQQSSRFARYVSWLGAISCGIMGTRHCLKASRARGCLSHYCVNETVVAEWWVITTIKFKWTVLILNGAQEKVSQWGTEALNLQ